MVYFIVFAAVELLLIVGVAVGQPGVVLGWFCGIHILAVALVIGAAMRGKRIAVVDYSTKHPQSPPGRYVDKLSGAK